MASYVIYRDGGRTSEEGWYKLWSRLFGTGFPLNQNISSMQVSQRAAGANYSVDVAAGDVLLAGTNYNYGGWTDAVTNVTPATAPDSANPRIDALVVYVDLSVVSSSTNNNPNALAFKFVPGVASATPSAPTDATIQSALGVTVPFKRVANVQIRASAQNIVSSDISDARTSITGLATPAAGTVNFASLLSTIFAGQIQTMPNPSSAGGTVNYINLGGLKILWGNSAANATNSNAQNFNVAFPNGFFNAVNYWAPTISTVATDPVPQVGGNGFNTSSASYYVKSNGTASSVVSFLAIGT